MMRSDAECRAVFETLSNIKDGVFVEMINS